MNIAALPSMGDRIRALNDVLRKYFLGGSITAAVDALEPELKALVLHTVREFDDFDEENDPYNEHDLFFFEVEGSRYFAKIDYYAPDMLHGSDNPADPNKTRRVLTIGAASDY
jgi:hypothetical protein